MQIFVKSIRGDTLTLVEASASVDGVKARLAELEGIPPEQQRLLYGARELESGRSLADYNVTADATLHLMLGLQGGLFHPGLRNLALMYNMNKMICRKCYCQLPARATRCRHAKCGRTTDIRPKKIWYYQKVPKTLKDWQKRGRWYSSDSSPYQLALIYNINKMICRKCYCQLPARATRCRHAKCGRTHH